VRRAPSFSGSGALSALRAPSYAPDVEKEPPSANHFSDDPAIARVLRTIDGYVGRAEQVVLCGLGVFVIFICMAWLITQHVGDRELEGASKDLRYAVFLMAMIGGAYAAHHRRLLSMELINRMVGARTRAWLRVVTTAFTIFITAVFFRYALDFYLSLRKEDTLWHWMPAELAQGAMAYGSGLLLFHLVVQIVIDLSYLIGGKVPPEPEMGAV
jgi:TRAP-type C4-dicarboxylate transport system permease small subunit